MKDTPASGWYLAGSRRLRVALGPSSTLLFEIIALGDPEGVIEIEGEIREDGCSNLDGEGVHLCDLEQLEDIGKAIRGAYALAAIMLPNYSGDSKPPLELELEEPPPSTPPPPAE